MSLPDAMKRASGSRISFAWGLAQMGELRRASIGVTLQVVQTKHCDQNNPLWPIGFSQQRSVTRRCLVRCLSFRQPLSAGVEIPEVRGRDAEPCS